jgi:Polyketide cyclase / dehydrase and lipid transport
MRPMTRLVLGVVVLIAILAAVAVGLPSHVTVTRSVVINAPESAIFPYLNNLHEFRDWSPWSVRDPQLAVTYGGPQTGKGAQIKWTSRVPSIGTGSMEISETEPNRHVDLAVNFNGLDGTSSYDVVPAGSGSKVTWTFGYDSGSSPLKRWKALMLDGFVGSEYRAGLDRLKEKVEAERRPTTPTMGLTPGGGMSSQPQQPAATLPPGAAPPPGSPAGQGAALPPGQAAPPAGATGPATATPQAPAPQGAQPNAAPAAADSATPATTTAPKKKRRRQQQ